MSPRNKIIHIKRLTDGKKTPQELHREIGIRKSCNYCGGPAAIRIKILAPKDEIIKRHPEFFAMLQMSNPAGPDGALPIVQTTEGPMLKISDIGACEHCKADAERAAARGPSWCIVEIDRGPDPTNKIAAQVPDTLRSGE